MATSSTTLRLDSDLKKRIEKKLKATGLTLNGYFTLAAKQLDIQGKIPFEIKTPNEELTEDTLKALINAKAKDEHRISDETPGFDDAAQLIAYMKKRAKEID